MDCQQYDKCRPLHAGRIRECPCFAAKVLLCRADLQHDLADTFDAALQAVSGHHRANTLGRSGVDQITRLQVVEQ